MTFRRKEDIASDMVEMVVLSRSVVGVRGIEKGKNCTRWRTCRVDGRQERDSKVGREGINITQSRKMKSKSHG